MSGIVVDASVALAWCFPDETSDYADAVLVALKGDIVNVPSIWAVEIANAVLVGERTKRIMPVDVRRFEELLGALTVVENSLSAVETINNVLPLARGYKLSAYDAAYLELSSRLRAPLATLDSSLQRASRLAGIKIFKP